MFGANSALITTATLVLAFSSCIPKWGKGSETKGANGTSFGVALPIPEKVAQRMGYAGIFEMTTTSSGSPSGAQADNTTSALPNNSLSPANAGAGLARQRVFQRQVSFQGNDAGQVLLDKDSDGKFMEKGEVLNNLTIKLFANDGTVIYAGGAAQASIILAEGVNRIAFSMDCQAKAICADMDNLVIMPVTPPEPTPVPSPTPGNDGTTDGASATKTPVAGSPSTAAATACKCAVYQNSCIIWQPGQPYVIESKPAQSCSAEFCKTGFSEATYTKCGGSSGIVFSQGT